MKILFIAPTNYHRDPFLIGVAYISSFLKQHGHNVRLLNFSAVPLNEDIVRDSIRDFAPELLAISILSSHQRESVKQIAAMIRKTCDTPIVIGGPVMAVEAPQFLDNTDVDMICIGDGEYPLLELCDRMALGKDVSGIRSLWVRRRKDWVRNELWPLEQDLDRFPFPDRTLFPVSSRMQMIASRGCPHECGFCINRYMKGLYGAKRYLRFRSPGNVVAEMLELQNRHAPSLTWFYDDRFPLQREWIDDFVRLCDKNDVRTPFSINVYPIEFKEQTVEALKRVGLVELRIGIESGDESLREMMLNRRGYSNKLMKEVFGIARKHGLRTKAYNIIGAPGETVTTALKTLMLNIKTRPTVGQYSIFQPYPGTALYNECREKGYASKDITSVPGYFTESLVSTEYLSAEDVNLLRRFMQRVARHRTAIFVLSLLHENVLLPILRAGYCFYVRFKRV